MRHGVSSVMLIICFPLRFGCVLSFQVSVKELHGEDHDHHGGSITCHMCYLVEVGRSEKAAKMLSCKCCGKKYHRNCLKPWAQHRGIFFHRIVMFMSLLPRFL